MLLGVYQLFKVFHHRWPTLARSQSLGGAFTYLEFGVHKKGRRNVNVNFDMLLHVFRVDELGLANERR